MTDKPATTAITIEEKLESAINKDVAAKTLISQDGGGIAFSSIEQVMEFAKMMAVSRAAVPVHLRNNPGACLGVCVQALEWRMSPFSVANKSYFVSERLAYEAQLIQAVINQRAPIEGRIKGEYMGEGGERQLRVWAALTDGGEIVEYTSPMKKDIKVQNSPLWKSDPDQQLWYYSTRAMCRRHFPDVILGVYARDEIKGGSIRDITPKGEESDLTKRLLAAQAEPEVVAEEPTSSDVEKVSVADIYSKSPDGPFSEDLIRKDLRERGLVKDESKVPEKVSTELPYRDINDDVQDAEVAPEFVEGDVFPGSDEYSEGMAAAAEDVPEDLNPYDANPEYSNWLAGYNFTPEKKEDK